MSASREPVSGQPVAIRDPRPLAPVIVCLVAVVAAVAWLGAAFANVAPLDALPAWLRGVARTPLVLAVSVVAIPALFVLLAWPRRARPARNARSLYAAQALALMVVALPALPPFSPSILTQVPEPHVGGTLLLITTALRVPGLSLGVAVAMADPLVVQRTRSLGQRGPSPRALAGAAVAITLLAAGILVTALVPSECAPRGELGAQICVVSGTQLPDNYPIGLASFCAISSLLGAWLGYALGAAIAQADRWT